MERQRRSFTEEYKLQAVGLVLSSGRSITSVGKETRSLESDFIRCTEQPHLDLDADPEAAGLSVYEAQRSKMGWSCSSHRHHQMRGSSRLAWNSAKYLVNITSVSITSVNPACISLMVETIAGGPGSIRP
jgi:hypothetical protein